MIVATAISHALVIGQPGQARVLLGQQDVDDHPVRRREPRGQVRRDALLLRNQSRPRISRFLGLRHLVAIQARTKKPADLGAYPEPAGSSRPSG